MASALKNNLQEANQILQRFIARAGSLRLPMLEVAAMYGSSIIENFRQGGRPSRWKKSKRAEHQGGQTLLDTGRLMKSESTPQVQSDKIILGSNLPYARAHQLGVDKDIKTKKGIRKMRLPARPSLVLQKEDLNDASRVFTRWLTEGA